MCSVKQSYPSLIPVGTLFNMAIFKGCLPNPDKRFSIPKLSGNETLFSGRLTRSVCQEMAL